MLQRPLPWLLISLPILVTGAIHAADPKNPDPAAPAGADLPDAVVKFQKSLETMRDIEAKRLETRIDTLDKQLKRGKTDTRPGTKEALALQKQLNQRLKMIKSDKPFIPRLSPKDFAVGQIGELDDDVVLEMSEPGKEEATIQVMFDELTYIGGSSTPVAVSWTHARVYRPDFLYVRSPIVAPLTKAERNGDRNSPTNRMLHPLSFEIVDRKAFGLEWRYVLVPFKMDEVRPWLRTQAKPSKKK
jgi:hypothetical protein